ncbi:MAG: OmpA family protein [Thiolinea sp.]
MTGCTTQTNKPPAGTGQIGPVTDDGSMGGGNTYADGSGGSGGGMGGGGGSVNNGGSGGGYGGGGSGPAAGSGGSSYGDLEGLGGSNMAGNGYGGGSGQGGNYGGGGQGGGFGGGGAYGGNTKGSYTPADLRDPRSILAQRIIYFDYDQSTLRPEYRAILDAHGSLLADFPELNIRLEGHADERGSREYNVALSERRAYAVLDYLKIKGVKASQADVVGYGEEVPAAFGHGEGSWSKNRRVELIYAGE